MNSEMLPLFWRVTGTDRNGVQAVSLLMPARIAGEEPAEFPTDVFFRNNRQPQQSVDLRWSDEDSDLFMSLLDRVVEAEDEQEVSLDINDNVVQGIVQLVAVARFRTPWPSDEIAGDDFLTEREESEVGDLVAVNLRHGFVLGIVVGIDSIDATCILLESVMDGERVVLPDHSLIVINRNSLLPCSFADADTGVSSTLH